MQHGDEIAAGHRAGIAEQAIGRRTQAKAIAGSQLMGLLALPESEPALEHQQLLILDEGIGGRRIGDLGARRQLGGDQLKRRGPALADGRQRPAQEAGRGIAPEALVGRAGEPAPG